MFLNISSWWESLGDIEKIFWAIALVFSFLFLLQTILSFAGAEAETADGDADFSVDSDHGIGYQFFTIKNFIAFFTMFGWAGLAALYSEISPGMSVFLATIAGLAMVGLMFLLFRVASRMQESGTRDISKALHQVGQTYLRIPAGRQGVGKLHIQVQGSLQELDAITDDTDDIPTGAFARVISILNNRTLLVSGKY